VAEPLIFITNDDGIYSKGIYALQQAIAKLGRTIVVAPETEKSAVGHAITLSDPIRIREIDRGNGFFGTAVDGTPADCVKLGLRALLSKPPDVVLSGINKGANVGMSILYSGTVSAATEGVILGVPSLAISLDGWVDIDYGYAAKIAQWFTTLVLNHGLPPGVALNINVPNVPEQKINGIRLTKQGKSYYEEEFERREDPKQRTYYWMNGKLAGSTDDPDFDDMALREKYVSVTPLHYNLTDEESLNFLKSWDLFDRDAK